MATQTGSRKTPSASAGLLTIREAGERLKCSEMHVYRLIAAGELSAVDISLPGARRAKTRVATDEVAAYIGKHTRRPGHVPSPGLAST